jgi:hypothetical protein
MPHFLITRRRRHGVRQLAAAFDCQFIANLAEMSSSQRRKLSPSNISEISGKQSKAAASCRTPWRPSGAFYKKTYAALGVPPAKLLESMPLSIFIHAGETNAALG